jgi:hypothetical protein
MNRFTVDPARPITRPWQPPPPTPGRVDFFRIHALALDRLGDVLMWFLPEGSKTGLGTFWEGHHPTRQLMVRVSLLSGAWAEPDTGASGKDLVSLTAHLFGLPQGKASVALARKLGVAVFAHA